RNAVGMAPDQSLTSDAMQAIRDQAYKAGYEPIANAGTMTTDKTYADALNKIVAAKQGAARSFPGAVNNEVMDFVGGLRVPSFDAGDDVQMVGVLRDEARTAFAQGNNALGQAKRQAATAIEDQIERNLGQASKDGADLLKNFRDARTLMAKTHTIEDAIQEG